MSEPKTCPQCGTPLPPDAPSEQCLVCLARMLAGLDQDEPRDPSGTVGSVSARIRYLGDYELLEEIATGGMGIVYRARQVSLNREVAIKMIRGSHFTTREELRRFRSEAEAIARLTHPHIVTIFEVGEHEGTPYFSMEYVAGRNLGDLARERPLKPRQAAGYLQIVARAIQYAHEQGVLHRDLKPANVLIDGRDQPRVTDFGLAKLVGPPGSGNAPNDADGFQGSQRPPPEAGTTNGTTGASTLTGQILGTPGYLSPEQARGDVRAISPRSDVYCLGAVLYAILCSRPPFVADDPLKAIRLVAEADPLPLRRLNPGVPRDLETICHKCLEKEPARRYASAEALANDLGRFLNGEPIQARPVGTVERLWRWGRRHPGPSGGDRRHRRTVRGPSRRASLGVGPNARVRATSPSGAGGAGAGSGDGLVGESADRNADGWRMDAR